METMLNNAVSTIGLTAPSYLVESLPEVTTEVAMSHGRARLENYIADVFQACHSASVTHFLPLLCALERGGEVTAALGLRRAEQDLLFSETYLDRPVEDYIEPLFGDTCPRQGIVELGNLVSSRAGDSGLLYLLVTAALHRAGVRYLLFTANRAVRASIRRSGYTPVIVSTADASRLGHNEIQWGTYYKGKPQVMLGDMQLTYQQSMAQPAMVRELERYELTVQRLAGDIAKLAG